MNTYLIAEMAWKEIEAAIAGGKDTVIVPITATEQHGPHLPLNTDEIIGEAVSVAIAAELGNALVAPAIRPGCSDHHLAFAGSLSISPALLENLIFSYCDNLKRYGFRTMVLLPSHGGNFDCVAKTAAALQEKLATEGVNVLALTNRDWYVHSFAEPLYAHGFSFDQVGVHAGAGETSLMMALRPDLVREECFVSGFVGEIDIPKLIAGGVKAVSENGVLGDPMGSTAEMGRGILDYIVKKYAAQIREAII
jgi:creatinine amidohydrolase